MDTNTKPETANGCLLLARVVLPAGGGNDEAAIVLCKIDNSGFVAPEDAGEFSDQYVTWLEMNTDDGRAYCGGDYQSDITYSDAIAWFSNRVRIALLGRGV